MRQRSIVALLVLINIFPVVSIYAWQMSQRRPQVTSIEFKVLVNGMRETYVLVPVDLNDGLTREDCEEIAETVFKQIMGNDTLHRLDRLTIDGGSMEVHYTWGYDESDMGHFFDITGDVTSRTLTVTHCR